MHIALNLMFVDAGLAGGRVYCEGLLRGFAELGGDDEFTLFTRRDVSLLPLPGARFHLFPSPVPSGSSMRRTWWEYVRLPGAARRAGCDVVHGLGNVSSLARGLPLVLTIHDLLFLHYPESNPLGHRMFLQMFSGRIARQAARIIVPSHYTAQEVITHLGVNEECIRLISHGPGNLFRRQIEEEGIRAVLTKLGIRRPFVLSVARGYPHKNLLGLLKAISLMHASQWPDLQVVLVGERHRDSTELDKMLIGTMSDQRIIATGFVDQATLNALYCAAAVFVFPSLAEGFGLPPLEAMACGTPVVASNATAIPEVVGDAGLLVDACDPEALADAISRVLNESTLREELREKGFRRVASYSWAQCGSQTRAVYHELKR